MKIALLIIFIFVFAFGAFAQVDPNLTPEAKLLYQELYSLSRDFDQGKILFGQQGAFSEGRGWRLDMLKPAPVPGDLPISDVAKVIGKAPMLVGYDFSGIGHWNKELILEN